MGQAHLDMTEQQRSALAAFLNTISQVNGDESLNGGDFIESVSSAYRDVMTTGALTAALGSAFEPFVFYMPSREAYSIFDADVDDADPDDAAGTLDQARHFFLPDKESLKTLRDLFDEPDGRLLPLSQAMQLEAQRESATRDRG